MKDKFLDNYMNRGDFERMIFKKRANNVKIVNHPINGIVYVCPYPESHFPDLQVEAQHLRWRKIKPIRVGIQYDLNSASFTQ